MSAFGTKRTSRRARSMSAFGGKADIARLEATVPAILIAPRIVILVYPA
jgi:hypothetical protein